MNYKRIQNLPVQLPQIGKLERSSCQSNRTRHVLPRRHNVLVLDVEWRGEFLPLLAHARNKADALHQGIPPEMR
jgi:hypothetical protein